MHHSSRIDGRNGGKCDGDVMRCSHSEFCFGRIVGCRFDKLKETALEYAFLLKTHGLVEGKGVAAL